jgi:hypothetical protein
LWTAASSWLGGNGVLPNMRKLFLSHPLGDSRSVNEPSRDDVVRVDLKHFPIITYPWDDVTPQDRLALMNRFGGWPPINCFQEDPVAAGDTRL